MSITELLFSFEGRTNRATWWLSGLALTVFIFLLVFIGFALMAAKLLPAAILLLLFVIPILWISLAIGAKRLHDRDKSGWWLLIFYIVPSILNEMAKHAGSTAMVIWVASGGIMLWGIVELGFLRGTSGPNEYGSDPLQ